MFKHFKTKSRNRFKPYKYVYLKLQKHVLPTELTAFLNGKQKYVHIVHTHIFWVVNFTTISQFPKRSTIYFGRELRHGLGGI